MYYGKFTIKGYTMEAISETEEKLDKVLKKDYYDWRKMYMLDPMTWVKFKEYSGVRYVEIKFNEIFGDHL